MSESRIESIFHEALAVPEDERDAFLTDACAGDAELRGRVAALLRAAVAGRDFMPALATDASAPYGEQSGELIDRYKLLEEIGEGGFGTVWMAEQQEPVRRKVALKVIKVGMDTRQVIARFEVERQALAMMDHPNIAKVLDGGATPSGRPYFVMELIRGVPITEYCDQVGLGTGERLELFQQICYAVQHAHQKGVIHRDLKPSNILVTLHDGVPVPKVIDFGIAKATSSELTQRTLFTEFRQMIGTPEYMAPEQAEFSGLDIDTRADVYSLGVLLYELLTGTKPFDSAALAEKGYLEMLRVIREEEPPKPSTRLSTLGARLPVMATQRHTTPKQLSRVVRGDLDWIVMRALEKDRGRRYATAHDLAADIGRHLSDEAVNAGPPSAGYKLRKYVRRHRVSVTAGAAIAVALVAGLAAATWGYFEAEAKRRLATTEAARANAVVGLLEELLSSADPARLKGKDYTVRQLLDAFDLGLDTRLEDQPEVEALVRQIISGAYRGLGEFEKAVSHAQKCLSIRRRLHSDGAELARSLDDLALSYRMLGRVDDSVALWREAVEMRIRLHGRQHAIVALSLNNLAATLLRQGKIAEADKLFDEAVAIWRALLRKDDPSTLRWLDHVGSSFRGQRKYAEAANAFREAVALKSKHHGSQDPRVGHSLMQLGQVLQLQGQVAEGEACYRKALENLRQAYGNVHPAVADALQGIADALMKRQAYAEAETVLRDQIEVQHELLGANHPRNIHTSRTLSRALAGQGNYSEAEAVARRGLELARARFDSDHRQVAWSLSGLGEVLLMSQQWAKAEPVLREATALGPKHPHRFKAMGMHGVALLGIGKHAEAEPLLLRAHTNMAKGEPVASRKTPAAWLVELYESWGKPDEAARWRQVQAGAKK